MFKTYKITCETGTTYYGSTKQKLNTRLNQHKKMKMNDIQFFTNPKIELIKSFETKNEMYQNERYNIENNECCNIVVPLRTKEERKQIDYFRDKELKKMKEYRDKNKDKMNEYKRETWEKTKDIKNKERAKKIICKCGSTISKSSNWEHKKTKKHIDF
jgi:pyruvate/2-oxoacid:ferredoxin oxidoreductase alpha subunit